MMDLAAKSRLIAETNKLIGDARGRLAQLRESLQSLSGDPPARSRVLSELDAIEDKLSRLRTLRNLVAGPTADPDMHPGRTLMH